jgi:heat shock protein HtpX
LQIIMTAIALRPGLDLFTQKRHRVLNRLHTWLLIGGSLLLLAVSAWIYAGPVGIGYAVVFGAVSLFAMRRVSPPMVLRMYKAQPVTRAQFPLGVEMIEELSRRAELPSVPKLHVVPSNLMNAFAVGRQSDSAIAVTDALVRNLTARELAGVLAHEISHIAHEDIKVMALADVVSRFTSFLSTMGMFTAVFNLGGFFQIPWSAVLLLLVAPTVGSVLQLALSRTREFDADLGAAMLTGDPDGLSSALVKLERGNKRGWEGMILPGGRIPDPSILRSHPRTEDRIAKLNALKQAGEAVARGEEVPERVREQVAVRPSNVPKIRRQWGRAETADAQTWTSLMNVQNAQHPPFSKEDAEKAACKDCLAQPGGKPRIHMSRGGVWW